MFTTASLFIVSVVTVRVTVAGHRLIKFMHAAIPVFSADTIVIFNLTFSVLLFQSYIRIPVSKICCHFLNSEGRSQKVTLIFLVVVVVVVISSLKIPKAFLIYSEAQ